MKSFLLLILFAFVMHISFAQTSSKIDRSKYFKLEKASENSNNFRTELYSDIDTTWANWQFRGYNFGFDPKLTPIYTTVNGILSTPYMIQVRGNEIERNRKRWGFHVFEGYAKDDKSRITLLLNKHVENDKPVAELYYYGTEYNHSELAYNWFRIGSDVRQHSFLFSRDKAIFYGSLKLSNTLTLGNIGKEDLREEEPKGDAEVNFEESAKYVNHKALKESENGTMFYDKDNNIVVIKVNGEWMKLVVEKLPENIKYDF
ncbi:hypothetical protein [Aquiflexum gelatinilyticum]|uniref:DUF4861 domain-containing protein n=1 Tax=Aquiflexum gelatinilyticum TaxID=2961943 RepID=A0A9X2P8W9_9BACT|nr:hypothetical protein [Aquiflexum gelatinilyticum]MCR9017026.1 hypothetical protein [Aquiflexum gelatinilyticum]